MSVNECVRAFQSRKSGIETPNRDTLLSGFVAHNDTMRFPSVNGSGRRSTASTTLKIAVLAPMPSAMVKTTITVKSG